jgi:hypothetical protein
MVSAGWSVKTEMLTGGQADWRQQLLDTDGFDPRVRYRLRGHIYTTNSASGSHSIELQWFNSGTYISTTKISATIANQWTEVSAEDIVPPPRATSVWVLLRSYQPGSYWFDDIVFIKKDENQVNASTVFPIGIYDPPSIELLKNGDFSFGGSPASPASWSRWVDAGTSTQTWDGAVVTTLMSSDGQADWRQKITHIDQSQQYRLSGKVWANNVASDTHGISIQWFDASDNYLGQTSIAATVASRWQSVSAGGLSPPTRTSYAWVLLRSYTRGTYAFDDLSLKLDWTHQQRFNDARKAGFELVTPWATDISAPCSGAGPEYCLDEVRAANLTEALTVDTNLALGSSSAPLEARLKAYRAHSALGVWSGPDEAALNGIPSANLLAGYAVLDRADQPVRHPLWLNHAPRGGISDKFDDLADYRDAADIHSMDIYPLPIGNGHSNLSNQTISCVGEYVDIIYNNIVTLAGVQRKPIWMVLQGLGWTDHDYAMGKGYDEHSIEIQWFDRSDRFLGLEKLASDQPNEWQNVFTQKITPAPGAVKAWILLRPKRVGTYYFDDLSFSKGGPNLLRNADIEASSGGSVASWTSHIDAGSVSFNWDTAVVHSGARSLKIMMQEDGLADWRQLVDGIDDKRQYSFSGWIYKALRPIWSDTRFMAYDAIIHGARGLVYWGINYVPVTSELWGDLRRLAGELSSLSSVLTSPISFRDVWVSTYDIETLLLGTGAEVYLLAANRKPYSVSTTFSISGLPLFSANRVFEAGSITMVANHFGDYFSPYQVHVYRIR